MIFVIHLSFVIWNLLLNNMLLAIDIGNTNITFGLFKGRKLIRTFNIPTYAYSLGKLRPKLGALRISEAIICSVVPKVSRKLAQDLKKLTLGKVYILGKNVDVPIKNLYRKPAQVGQDRLVNAYAGVKLYGAPLIIIDFGTAVTFDCISKRKEYLGGMILPGLRISLEALNSRTALLPKINLSKPKDFIGRDTKTSMLSGIVYGFGALTDDLVSRIRKKIGMSAKVIITGGDSTLIVRYIKSVKRIDSAITLKGLNLISRDIFEIVKKNT